MKTFIFRYSFIVMLWAPLGVFSQEITGQISVGGSAYLGDLVQGGSLLKQMYPAVTVGGGYGITERFKTRLSFSILGAKGDDELNKRLDYQQRNLSFKTNIWELALLGEYDILNPIDNRAVPYVMLGPSLYHFNPSTIDKNGNKVYLHDVGTEGQFLPNPAYSDRKYNLTQLNIQFGGGIKYRISETVSIDFELLFRKLFTDYLDDVSTEYPTAEEFLAAGQTQANELSYRGGEISQPNDKIRDYPRGNPDKKDLYYTFQIGGIFRLNNKYFNR